MKATSLKPDHEALPFQGESWDRLRDRYDEALEPIYDCTEKLPDPLPSAQRKHVFDFNDGMRMIISRDNMADGLFLHFSVSVFPWSSFYREIKLGITGKEKFKRMCLQRFAHLTYDHKPFDHCLFTPGKGVPHWFRKIET